MSATATVVPTAFERPDAVLAMIRAAGPMWPIANYAANDAEMQTLAAETNPGFTPPWFRQDFARLGEPLVEGAEEVLHNPIYLDTARRLSGAEVIEPTAVYVNVMGPTPFAFPPHLDVPAFRGITRADHPIWLLKVMMSSGLFERWRTRILTAVSWFYEGPGGDFRFWPEGIDGPSQVISPPFRNVAVMADNERTFHAVAQLGPPDATLPEGLNTACRLHRGDGGWDIVDATGAFVGRIGDDEARITVSWKCDVHATRDDFERARTGEDALTIDDVVAILCEDLDRRSVAFAPPADPHADEAWVRVLADTYPEVAPPMPA